MAHSVGFFARGFNPWDSQWPTPIDGVWADDPLWANPGDGNAVSSTRNASGRGAPAQAVSLAQPTFRRNVSSMGNRAALEFVAANSQYLDFNITDVAQPFKVLAVAKANSADSTLRRFLASGGSTGGGIGMSAGNAYVLSWQASVSGGTIDANPHVYQALVNGTSSTLQVDASVVIAASNAGVAAYTRFCIGAGNASAVAGNYWNGHVAFVGFYNTTDDLTALQTALRAWYGI